MQGHWEEASGLHFAQVDPDVDGPDTPLIVCLHGRGADPADLGGLAYELFPEGYRWLFPQGPLPVPLGPPGMTGWAWYALGEQRAATVVEARGVVARFVSDAATRFGLTQEQICLMGFSQGAATSLHVAITSPGPFGAIVAMSGYLPAPESLESAKPAAQRILMVHGTQDQVLDVSLARQARARLEELGLQPRYQEFAMDHTITKESLAAVRQFLADEFPPRAQEA
jgi:phospholipase/carboxylesterase